MSRPFKVTVPLLMGRSPMMLSMVVVFPAPLRPTRHTVSASPTLSPRSRSTWAGPRKVMRPWTSSMAVRPQHVGGDLLVVADLVGCPVGGDGALVHGHDARAVGEHHVHLVLDDDGGDSLRTCASASARVKSRRVLPWREKMDSATLSWVDSLSNRLTS